MWFLVRAGCLMVVAELLLFGQLETAIVQTPQVADHHNLGSRALVSPSSLSEAFGIPNFDSPTASGMPRDFWDAQRHDPVTRSHHANSPYVTNALGTRGKMAIIGAALIGTGAALVTTADRSVDVPRSCYPFLGCRPAHTRTETNRVQAGIGGGLLLGGIFTLCGALVP